MTATLITSAGTATLTGKAADFAQMIAVLQGELEQVPFGSLEFHFGGKRPLCKLVQSYVLHQEAERGTK